MDYAPSMPPHPRGGHERTATPRARTRLDTAERRAQLLSLGIRFFSDHAYDEVSIEDVAREAGISKGLLYHYFPTKRDFYIAAIREGARQLVEATVPDETLPPIERARAAIDSYLGYVERHGPAYASVLRSGIGSDPEVFRIVEATRQEFLDRMRGAVPFADAPAVRIALLGWIGFVEVTSLEWVERPRIARSALRDLLASVLVASVEIAAGSPG
jgi:AcrR family transcriptional regulator